MGDALDWEREGRDWPHRAASRFVHADGLRWHVQLFDPPAARPAPPPVVVLLHGTGASTHSWRGVAPLLARHAQVVACDLPGHAFTAMPAAGSAARQFSLPGMAGAVGALLDALRLKPQLLVGHSAGAAVALRMCLDGLARPRAVVGINAALLPWGGPAGPLFSAAARLMASTRLVPRMFAWRAADPAVLRRLADGTGSTLDAQGLALYGRLAGNPGHAAAALAMMANWDLTGLVADLPRLRTPLKLLVGGADKAVPPRQAPRALAPVPAPCRLPLLTLDGLGHLAHEERPDLVAAVVVERLEAA